jgi:hypothetical protein
LIARFLAAVAVTFGGKFNLKEQVTIGVTLLPKATIVAAFGTQFYTDAKAKKFS